VNKNSIYGDTSALSPGGVRVGTPALTSRGFVEKDFEQVADFLHRAATLCQEIMKRIDSKKLSAFKEALVGEEKMAQLKKEVEAFATKFPMPGFDAKINKYCALE
jgi:glycine hydroxymethyltransferase